MRATFLHNSRPSSRPRTKAPLRPRVETQLSFAGSLSSVRGFGLPLLGPSPEDLVSGVCSSFNREGPSEVPPQSDPDEAAALLEQKLRMSPKDAQELVKFDSVTPQQVGALLDLLLNHWRFDTNSTIYIIQKAPRLLNPARQKLDTSASVLHLLVSLGHSTEDVRSMISSAPTLLLRSPDAILPRHALLTQEYGFSLDDIKKSPSALLHKPDFIQIRLDFANHVMRSYNLRFTPSLSYVSATSSEIAFRRALTRAIGLSLGGQSPEISLIAKGKLTNFGTKKSRPRRVWIEKEKKWESAPPPPRARARKQRKSVRGTA